MTSSLLRLEKISREIIEKQEELMKSSNLECSCFMCNDHQKTLMRANYQATTLVRGLVAYMEKIRQDRREKRRRHKENVNLRKTDF
jgi:hypothetical protein